MVGSGEGIEDADHSVGRGGKGVNPRRSPGPFRRPKSRSPTRR
jgi:hypothetical protein